MPRPLYIICSESGSEDKLSGLVSFYRVIDAFQIHKTKKGQPPPPTGALTVPLRVTAAWRRSQDDVPTQEWDFQFVFKFSPGDKVDVVSEGQFTFDKGTRRFVLVLPGIAFNSPGTFQVESRIRRSGDPPGEWISQDYPISVDDVTQAPVDAAGD
ncbi:MAG: hypothetical protein K2R98_16790 [Gemmataceae bacterium]|nr:hypothetical protein [Gemmataceae bacterium]